MLKELLDNQRRYTEHFFDHLDLSPIEQLIEMLLNNNKTIFFTGIGKSGLVAKKIAYTMISTGTRAHYLSPTDALHGDLGMVSKNDAFIILSKSGESEELLQLIPAIRNKGAHIVGVICNPLSRVGKQCNRVIQLPFYRELCPFDMAPTTSTTSQLLFGDLLTISLMKRNNFSLSNYALNHPSGQIGKRITLKVKDLMLTDDDLPLCRTKDTLKESLVTLSNKKCGCIMIIDDERNLCGIFTDGDLRRALCNFGANLLEKKMFEIMIKNPQTISAGILAWDAMKIMENDPLKRITALPVVDAHAKLEGLLLLHDIIKSGL